MSNYTDNLVKDHERIDILEPFGLYAIQNPKWFRFGTDSILLAYFVQAKKESLALDLGTGSGVIALLMWGRYKPRRIVGIEVQPGMADMAKRSIQLNNLTEQIQIIEGDYTDHKIIPQLGQYDYVVANPPYIAEGIGDKSIDESHLIARHEVRVTLEAVIETAAKALRNEGRFALVHLPNRLSEIFCYMEKYRLVPKRACMVQPFLDKPPYLVMIDAVKNGRPGITWEPVLNVYDKDGKFSDKMQQIYAGTAG